MKIKQLRAELAKLDSSHDERNIVIWLPGSRIDLEDSITNLLGRKSFMILDDDGSIMIEGNLREGSALS